MVWMMRHVVVGWPLHQTHKHTHSTHRQCDQFNSVHRTSIATVIQYRKKKGAVKEGGGEEDSGGGVVFGHHATPCHATPPTPPQPSQNPRMHG